jgi:hypothetical protein
VEWEGHQGKDLPLQEPVEQHQCSGHHLQTGQEGQHLGNLQAYKPSRNYINHVLGKYYPYSNNPNYQASLYKPYYHRVLTESEQRAFEEEAPKIIQAYIKPKEEDLAPISGSLYSLYSP